MLVRRLHKNGFNINFSNKSCGVYGRRYTKGMDAFDFEERVNDGLTSLPSKAKVVICGGGLMGSAVAYHLGKRGWGEHTVVIEREK